MKKILLVLKNEVVTLLTRPSFWIAALGIPLMGAVLLGAYFVTSMLFQPSNPTIALAQVANKYDYANPVWLLGHWACSRCSLHCGSCCSRRGWSPCTRAGAWRPPLS